ncbi:uncharacterized protein LOC120195662 [Hibiscus syriacus]|uniref:uncharacterized protein LOC120195662 n=1 Tax=Hibiscus syriacus TaxID=106335 RepID=UPI001921D812|nr:uncharacterized protein LOC120195662 [Hibiscus syriacus]
MGKRTSCAKVDVKKALSSPRPSSLTARKNQNLKVVRPQKNQNNVEKAETEQPLDEHDVRNNDALEEKTLYSSTLPMSPPLSSHVGGDENEYTDDSSNSEYYEDDENAEDETVNVEEVEILEGENGGRPRNSRTEFSDEKDCRPVKLSFRRGKGERRTFKTRELDGSVDENQPGGEKVVLRHQDLQQGKKDEKGLFNTAIEETASKLVETRKSKVKALVGAFETFISLQDAKPLANT